MDAWPDHWPRPARLLPRPEPIETMALLPDHPPRWILWRGVRRHVQCADGPERIFGEWWKLDAEAQAVRDYFRIEGETGARCWIFRQGDGEDRVEAHLQRAPRRARATLVAERPRLEALTARLLSERVIEGDPFAALRTAPAAARWGAEAGAATEPASTKVRHDGA